MAKIEAKNKTSALFTLIKPFNDNYTNPTDVELEITDTQHLNLNECGIEKLESDKEDFFNSD